MKTALKLAVTYRLYFLPVVYFTVLFGFIATGQEVSGGDYVNFALIALSAHIFGFGVNDWSDLPYDKKNPRHIKRSMLVRGELKLSWHQVITLIQFPILVAWAFILNAPFESFLMVAISIILLTIYNLLAKKKNWMVILIDCCFPLSLAFLFLAGYSLNQPLAELSIPDVLLVITLFFGLFIANSVQGGFRDMEADLTHDAGNFLGALDSKIVDGVRVTGRITRSISYGCYLVTWPLLLAQAWLNHSPWWHLLIITVLVFYGFMDLAVMLNLKKTDGLKTTDYYVASAYIFYAALIPWMHHLPDFLWVVVGINLLYPFVVHHKTHFGWQTFGAFFRGLRA